MKLLGVINNGKRGFIFHSYLMNLNKQGKVDNTVSLAAGKSVLQRIWMDMWLESSLS